MASIQEMAAADYRDLARSAGRLTRLQEGEVLFREGEEARDVFVLLSGTLQIAAHGRTIETVR